MNYLQHVLEGTGVGSEGVRFPIVWSDAAKKYLSDVGQETIRTAALVDVPLAGSLLKCAEAQFAEAEREILALLRENLALVYTDNETFISFLNAAFTVQRFDIVAALLRDRYGFGRTLEISVREDGPGRGRVQWEVLPSGNHRFTFDALSFTHDSTRLDILSFQWEFPVYSNYSFTAEQPPGSIIINQTDIGLSPGLAWCESRPDYFLIPDCVFIPSKGHEYIRRVTAKNNVPWNEKKEIAFWRGATTGVAEELGNWRTLERVRLAEIGKRYEYSGIIDVGLSGIKQIQDPAAIAEIEQSGLIKGHVPWEDWSQYKYLIEIDGNCNSWSNLFQRLLTGSAVLRVESVRGLRQWFYDRLVPWENYVPIAPNLSDLVEKIEWLRQNDEYARKVGEAGRALAQSITYEPELARSALVILQCFRYFNGQRYKITPYGK